MNRGLDVLKRLLTIAEEMTVEEYVEIHESVACAEEINILLEMPRND